MSGRILVTPRSLSISCAPSLDPIRKAGYEIVVPAPGRMPTESELLESVPSCIGWIVGVEKVSPAVIDSAAGLRAISRNAGLSLLKISVFHFRLVMPLFGQNNNEEQCPEAEDGKITRYFSRG